MGIIDYMAPSTARASHAHPAVASWSLTSKHSGRAPKQTKLHLLSWDTNVLGGVLRGQQWEQRVVQHEVWHSRPWQQGAGLAPASLCPRGPD